MSRIGDWVLDQEEQGNLEYNAITGSYEPTKGVGKGKQESTLEDALAFASEYMKTPEFAKEWENFKQTGKF